MRLRDSLRFLFPAVFSVIALGALVAASVFQAHLPGTGGEQASLPPAIVPSISPGAAVGGTGQPA